MEVIMHNLISHNELASWKWDQKQTVEQKYDQVSGTSSAFQNVGLLTTKQGDSADTS